MRNIRGRESPRYLQGEVRIWQDRSVDIAADVGSWLRAAATTNRFSAPCS